MAATNRPGGESVILVTGLSGAGRSSALHVLEDCGFEAIDNVPLGLLPNLLRREPGGRPQRLAAGVDIRTRDFGVGHVLESIDDLRTQWSAAIQLVYIECDDDVLVRRFAETRRRHPLAGDRPVSDGIARERALLAPLRVAADLTIDTSGLTLGELNHVLAGACAADEADVFAILVLSFAYREGIPRESDLVFDMRFLDNPHYREGLRELTGQDEAVAEFIARDGDWANFFDGLRGLLLTLLPRYRREGKSLLTISVGCTGGRHRSVFTAEALRGWLRENGYKVNLLHRDIAKRPPVRPDSPFRPSD